jgi:benzil reductase ((S)-benzoin forming)
LRQWLAAQPAGSFSHATLINNAALLPPIAPLRDADDDALVPALRVGLEAPMLFTAAFLAATRGWAAQRRVLNISSGLGRRAMASQSGYCAVKAGMDPLHPLPLAGRSCPAQRRTGLLACPGA